MTTVTNRDLMQAVVATLEARVAASSGKPHYRARVFEPSEHAELKERLNLARALATARDFGMFLEEFYSEVRAATNAIRRERRGKDFE